MQESHIYPENLHTLLLSQQECFYHKNKTKLIIKRTKNLFKGIYIYNNLAAGMTLTFTKKSLIIILKYEKKESILKIILNLR